MKSVEQKIYEAYRDCRGVTLTSKNVEDLILPDDAIRVRITNRAATEADTQEIGNDYIDEAIFREMSWKDFCEWLINYEELLEYIDGEYLYVHRECLLQKGDKDLIDQFHEYERCPECLRQCCQEGEPSDLVKVSDKRTFPYGYYGTEYYWREHWKCPECDHEWEIDNST